MANRSRKNAGTRAGNTTRYDAHHHVLAKTYGALTNLRRELSDSKTAIAERSELLKIFADCNDSQRAWLLLEDYFEKLSLSRKDFSSHDWWPRLMAAQGQKRLEETAILFLRANRPLPTELLSHANLDRFAEIEQAEEEQKLAQQLEHWLFPPAPVHLDSPRAMLRILCEPKPIEENSALHGLSVNFILFRPRTGEKNKSLSEIIELTTRASHEQELFSPPDWEIVQWLTENYAQREKISDSILLTGLELLQWLARWSGHPRLELTSTQTSVVFDGHLAELKPQLKIISDELSFSHQLVLPNGENHSLERVYFFAGSPSLVLVEQTFYLLRNAPPATFLGAWAQKKSWPVRKLSRRLLTHLRKTESNNGSDWEQLCTAHSALPQFIFELTDETIRLRLLAKSDRDQSIWRWHGHDWQMEESEKRASDKPEILDDPRLEEAAQWLRRLDWFTPEPGVWLGDANEFILSSLADAWTMRPTTAEYLGNPAFHRLFLNGRALRPQIIVQGSGIDWFSISAEWEMEGLKLTPADLQRLQSATGRFVKLPDAGWMKLDAAAVQTAQETFAELGLETLSPLSQRVRLQQAAHLDETARQHFGDSPAAKTLRESLANFSGIASTLLPENICAELRPYQKSGFDFLCHLSRHKLGGILADDMGLGKTLQTLAWLAWLRAENHHNLKPALVICPASVLHNWRRESERFTPHLKVLVLESG
ncbi:MAG: SNF2-related protein, partial [Limisphaerales bacterium]